jgi:hypothetical protein
MSDTTVLSPRRTALGMATFFGGLAVTAGIAIGAAAGIGAAWHATNPPVAAPAAAAPAGAAVRVVIKNVSTPDGPEPAFIGPGGVGKSVLLDLHAGTPTLLTIDNTSDQPHTFDVPSLGVDVNVPPGPATVHVTLDAKTAGTLPWHCDVPCGGWVMSHAGYMMGDVEVTS